MSTRTYRAYDARGNLKLCTWARGPMAQAMERDVYQTRLDHCEFLWVDVASSDPEEPVERIRPRAADNA